MKINSITEQAIFDELTVEGFAGQNKFSAYMAITVLVNEINKTGEIPFPQETIIKRLAVKHRKNLFTN